MEDTFLVPLELAVELPDEFDLDLPLEFLLDPDDE